MQSTEFLQKVADHYEQSPDLASFVGPIKNAMVDRRKKHATVLRRVASSGDLKQQDRWRLFLVLTCPFGGQLQENDVSGEWVPHPIP